MKKNIIEKKMSRSTQFKNTATLEKCKSIKQVLDAISCMREFPEENKIRYHNFNISIF